MNNEELGNGTSTEPPDQPEQGEEAEAPSKADAFSFKLYPAADQMSLLFDCPSIPEDIDSLLETIRGELRKRGVPTEWLGDALEQRLRDGIAGNQSVEGLVLVEGQPAVPPTDGRIEWGGPYFTPGFELNEETGAVDYRKPLARTAVADGDLLATVVPVVPGTDGRDINGKIIKTGKGEQPSITTGPNVRKSGTGGEYFAAMTGRVRLAGKALAVDPVYTVEGDVGLETGDISHPGAVVVHGDVQPGMAIKALGSIEVSGVIERADIVTSGDLVVHCGIMGKGKEKIFADGQVHALFINEAEIEAMSDLVIEREILQSAIRTMGSVNIPRGRIVGGDVMAFKGILAGQTGSEAAVPTIITPGSDFHLHDRIQPLYAKMRDAGERRDKLVATTEHMIESHVKVPPKVQKVVDVLGAEVQKVIAEITDLQAKIEHLKAQSIDDAEPHFEVTGMIYPDTIINIGANTLRVKDTFQGPIHALAVKDKILLKHGGGQMMADAMSHGLSRK